MRRILAAAAVGLLLLLSIFGVSACGESRKNTPDAAVEAWIHLFNARDFGEAYDSLASTSPWRYDPRGKFVADMQGTYGEMATSYRWSEFSATEVIIEGDRATVAWTAIEALGMEGRPGEQISSTATVVKEGGVWKVELPWSTE